MSETSENIPFIQLDSENSDVPLYRQIYESIRKAILNGEIASKTRLPSTRTLAKNLNVSRITTINAYEQLFAEGYLEGKVGAGTFVASKLPDDLLLTTGQKLEITNITEESPSPPLALAPFGKKLLSKDIENLARQLEVKMKPFQNGLTAIDEFPFAIWARIAQRYIKNPPRSMLGYGNPQGFPPLRRAIAAHLNSARSVNCTPEQIIITSGAQQALDLTARLFLSTGDKILIENPSYLEARNSFAATGAEVLAIDVDGEGLNAEKIQAEAKNIKIVYVTPSHQYPLGVTMSLPRRLALLDWATKNNAWIVEDDYNSEFRYAGRPLASLQGLDKTHRVIYVGTFSKTIFPSLRIGCVVVPPELVKVFTLAKALSDVHSPTLEQAILADFIAEGHFARHVRRMRTLYEERRDVLFSECRQHLDGLLEVEKADAGMHLVGWLPEGIDDQTVSRLAFEKGLKLAAISDYSNKKIPRGGIILGYTAFDENQIKEGVKKIREILISISANRL